MDDEPNGYVSVPLECDADSRIELSMYANLFDLTENDRDLLSAIIDAIRRHQDRKAEKGREEVLTRVNDSLQR